MPQYVPTLSLCIKLPIPVHQRKMFVDAILCFEFHQTKLARVDKRVWKVLVLHMFDHTALVGTGFLAYCTLVQLCL